MNVLMIATEKLPVPPVRGGAIQTYIAGVAPILARHHRLTILGRTDPALPKRNTEGNITYERVESEGSFKKYRKAVAAFLKGRSYDLIHIFNRPRLVLPVAEAVPGARIILSMHNDMFIPRKIAPEEAAAVIEKVERIITVSNYVGRTIKAMYPQAAPKLRTIYSGVDLDRFSPPLTGKAREIRESLRKKHQLQERAPESGRVLFLPRRHQGLPVAGEDKPAPWRDRHRSPGRPGGGPQVPSGPPRIC